ncbi:hypothetical protein [Salinivibrio sp. ML290]|uniref:hypothetical protein n=1 Tax=Salinivibrio sp. ML290 TaxID=1909468 RepID=UPI00098879D2|nr:hypothetical protein [Salinivibrio sp. ML290]OOE76073.1 hypothetical protein BZG23_05205 [Salinivibrio sp. ML290]
MTTSTNGILSQAIANMQASEKIIRQFSGLPSNAIAIQQSVENTVTDILPQIQQMQTQVLSFAESLSDELKKQIELVDTESAAALQAFVNDIQQQAKPTQQLVQESLQQTRNANASITQNIQALEKISVQLKANIAGLQSNLQGEQQELDALNKKKYYLLGLGVFGAPGLIALGVLISKAQDKVHGLESQIKNCQTQINQQQSFLMQTQHFNQDFSDLTDKVSKVGNALSFVIGDVNNIAGDIEHDGITDRSQIKLYFTAASQELKSLVNDAS